MRSLNELEESKKNGTLSEQILLFTQKFRSLLIPSPEVLVETIVILYPLVDLSDKVLPLKSYFRMVQQVQRTHYVKSVLASEVIEGELDIDEYKQFVHKLEQDAQRYLCTEDIFMVACSFLEVEIAKQGSVYYLRGESPNFKETKKNRNPVYLADEVSLKKLSSNLARPDEERGEIERGQIDSGFNYLVKLNNLKIKMKEAISWIREGEQKNIPRSKVDIRKYFHLSHTDYEKMMAMARREGFISFRNRKKDPSNSFILKSENYQRVVELATRFGYSPQKTLNKILDDYFDLIEKQREKIRVEY